MVRTIRCIHCGSRTNLIYKSLRSRHDRSIIILNNAPMHYCPKCNDNLISAEAITTFRYIKALPLKPGDNEFNFTDTYPKIEVVG